MISAVDSINIIIAITSVCVFIVWVMRLAVCIVWHTHTRHILTHVATVRATHTDTHALFYGAPTGNSYDSFVAWTWTALSSIAVVYGHTHHTYYVVIINTIQCMGTWNRSSVNATTTTTTTTLLGWLKTENQFKYEALAISNFTNQKTKKKCP